MSASRIGDSASAHASQAGAAGSSDGGGSTRRAIREASLAAQLDKARP